MSDDFSDYVEPIRPKAAIDRLEHERGGPPPPPARAAVRGQVLSVRRGQVHKEGRHRLDVTVGAGESTEIIVRVPNGAYTNWEGKKVVLHLED